MAIATNVTELKAQLGLSNPKADKGAYPPEIDRLLEGFNEINEEHSNLKTSQIRVSESIKRKANNLFDELGPTLWPDINEQPGVPPWLSYPSESARLFYSDETHRKL